MKDLLGKVFVIAVLLIVGLAIFSWSCGNSSRAVEEFKMEVMR